MAGPVQIKVRQVLGFGSDDIAARVQRINQSARGWLDYVVPKLVGANMEVGATTAFGTCFLTAPSPEKVNAVRSILTTVQRCISAAHGVKVRADDDAYGYVTSYYGGRKHLINGIRVIDSDGDVVARKGEIHLDTATVKHNMTMAVITYIHEATHRFAHTDDHDDRGYFRSDGSAYSAVGLTATEALINADSHAYFVYKTVQAGFTSVSVR